jgi:hypothetical protein
MEVLKATVVVAQVQRSGNGGADHYDSGGVGR